MRTKPCVDLMAVRPGPAPEGGCIECLAAGDEWVHLRFCVACGGVRCCDDSPNQHASKHARAEGHRVIRSAEPGEMWAYCYEHGATLLDVESA